MKALQSLGKRALGDSRERQAAAYLQQHGARIKARNYTCRWGEIDLIVEVDNSLCFVEVRHRSQQDFGGAAQSVTPGKQKKLIASAQHYLQRHPRYQQHACRFDVIAIEGEQLHWLKDAFQL